MTKTSRSYEISGVCNHIIDFIGKGWQMKIRKRRFSYFMTIAKEVILGNCLGTGDDVYSYLVRYRKRNVLLIFLDGKQRSKD
jgi:hypothetical protein